MDTEFERVFDGELTDWVNVLPAYQQKLVGDMLSNRKPVDVAVAWLSSTGPKDTASFGTIRKGIDLFYDNLLSEIHSLLCRPTGYPDERREVIRSAKVGRTAFVTAVCTAVGPHVGMSPVVLAPAVAITLAVVGQAGRGAVCSSLEQLIEDRRQQGNKSSK